ncbi:hypothetical protein B0H14DRAFT_2232006, partial [Mycena olivaceomarginata]
HLSPSGISSGSLFVESLAAEQHHVVVGLKILRDTSRHGHLGNAEKPFVSAPALISPAPSDIVSATLGHQHTIFLDSSGTVSRLGSNKKPQLDGIDAAGTYPTGDGDAWELLTAMLAASWAGTVASFCARRLSVHICDVACGSEHVLASFAVLPSSTAEVWDWGWNEHGSLGVGTTEGVRIPVKIWPTSGRVG